MGHDAVFYTLSALTVLFTLLVGLLVIFFTVRYRRGHKVDRSRPVNEHLLLEITWTGIPLLLGLVMFLAGAKQFVMERTPPKDAIEVFVIGKQWMWHFQHANGVRENNTLHVPVGKPVRLTMISQDVIHALYIPEFRVQYHVVPGRYTQLWFEPTKAGTYHLFCSMFCGTQHSEMGGSVIAMEPKDYAAWLQNGGNDVQPMSAEARGQAVYHRLGCDNCHGAVDSARAPSLIGIYGKPIHLQNGQVMVADDLFIRQAILNPRTHPIAGYPDPTMPVYDKQISEEDLFNLMNYVRSLTPMAMAPGEMLEPRVGEVPGSYVKPSQMVKAAGALANQDTPTSAPPRAGKMAEGALSAETKEN